MTRVPASSLLLRLLMVLGPVGALACGALAGHRASLTAYVVSAVLSVLYAVRPDAWFGTVLMVGVVIWWAQALDDRVPLAVLPAMVALTAGHLAGLLADLGPSRMALTADVARLWARRGSLAVLAAAALWVVAVLADDHAVPGVWVVAVVLGTSTAAGVALVLDRTREV